MSTEKAHHKNVVLIIFIAKCKFQIRTLAEFSVHCDARSALYVMLQLCRDLQSLQSQGVQYIFPELHSSQCHKVLRQ